MGTRWRYIRMMLHKATRGSRVLHAITILYVTAGFVIAVPSAFAGDRLGAFLGFIIITGTLAVAAILNTLSSLNQGIRRVDESLEGLRARIEELESVLTEEAGQEPEGSSPTIVNLASIGRGDPAVLTAATLDRSVFPRLIRTMDDNPPPKESAPIRAQKRKTSIRTAGSRPFGFTEEQQVRASRSRPKASDPSEPEDLDAAAQATDSLLRRWERAVEAHDLTECRRVYAALIDTTDRATAANMTEQLAEVAQRVERSLREAFSKCIRERDYAAALRVGEHICRQFADQPLAAEFRRIEPFLLRRISAATARRAAIDS